MENSSVLFVYIVPVKQYLHVWDIIVEGSNMQDALSKLGEEWDNEALNDMMKFQEGK